MNMTYYTSIEQVNNLLRLGLDPETVDMHWYFKTAFTGYSKEAKKKYEEDIMAPIYKPCWSVGALLELLDYPELKKTALGTWDCIAHYDNGIYRASRNTMTDAVCEVAEFIISNKMKK